MKKLPPDQAEPAVTTKQPDPSETLAVLGPVARSSVVDAVADRLRNEILAGRLAAGSRLPSERELSLALGVNRLTLRAALARLEAMGLVTTRHGSGTEVASWRERAGLEALPMVMGSLDPDEPAWLELLTSMLEVRRVLATEAVALAAVRHGEADIASMRAIAAEQRTRLHDAQAYARGDFAFQRAIVRAARNIGFELILNSFSRFPEEQPALVATLYDKREESVGFYEGIIALVQSGDAAAARAVLTQTFSAMDEEWLARHGHRPAGAGKAGTAAARPSAAAGLADLVTPVTKNSRKPKTTRGK
ncbi:MAG: Transcriptional regulator, GntR family [Labilithrix sp.]|nr:Transcriptional regulator, GntR family [Labilithrix sp.]